MPEASAEPMLDDASDFEQDFIDSDEPILSKAELARALLVLRTIRKRVIDAHRPRHAESTMRAVWCYLTYLSGATLDEQVRAADSATGVGDFRRKRNRIYKLRERGRKALQQACVDADAVKTASAAGRAPDAASA
jgi:hypothetical protein